SLNLTHRPALNLYAAGAAFVIAALLVFRRTLPRRIVVGTDGIVVEKAFRRQFVPLAAIDDARIERGQLVIALKHGGAIKVGVAGVAELGVIDRIEGAMRGTSRDTVFAAERLLDRAGRSREAWRDAVRSLTAATGDYRSACLDADTLERIARNPDAPAE